MIKKFYLMNLNATTKLINLSSDVYKTYLAAEYVI